MPPDRAVLLRRLWSRLRGIHVAHEGRGDSWTLYLGQHRGARFLGVDPRGFNGWSSAPLWMPGGWEFYNPTIYWGRVFVDGGGGQWGFQVKAPAKLVHAKRMLSPAYRRAMREEPIRDGR